MARGSLKAAEFSAKTSRAKPQRRKEEGVKNSTSFLLCVFAALREKFLLK